LTPLYSYRYLVQGPQGSVLHTGDLRAEPSFLKSVAEDPFLKPFLAQGGNQTLDAIYLDTACVWSSAEPPSKVRCRSCALFSTWVDMFLHLQRDATDGLVDLMARFPATKCFFINAWTWGYEDIFTAIAAHFGDKVSSPFNITPFFSHISSQIHVDRYKHCIYSHLSHEGLSRIITRDMSSTRFHACERFDRCEEVEKLGRSTVHVNPVTMGSEDWSQYLDTTRDKLKYGEEVTSLVRRSIPFLISIFSYHPSLALPFVETLALPGTASVREAL